MSENTNQNIQHKQLGTGVQLKQNGNSNQQKIDQGQQKIQTKSQENHNTEQTIISPNQKEQIKSSSQQEQKKNTEQYKEVVYDQQIPDKFYDSDLASVNQKDFISDNQPPKDIVLERKLLHKQKKLHIYKTIVRVGKGIDKPAPYDQIRLRFRNQPNTNNQGLQQAKDYKFIETAQFITYNLGFKNQQIQKLVTSMKQGQTAFFELDELEVSKKTNIKVLKKKTVYLIQVDKWTTVIDIDGNKQILKYLLRRGEGAFRVSKYDQITLNAQIIYKGVPVLNWKQKQFKIQQQTIKQMQPILWKVLCTMKKNQLSKITLDDYNMKVISALWQQSADQSTKANQANKKSEQNNNQQQNKIQQKQEVGQNNKKQQQQAQIANLCRYQQLIKVYESAKLQKNQNNQNEQMQNNKQWVVNIQILDLISIDDIFMDGTLLKKLLIKGVSTAKPQSSSYIYYALKYLDSNKNVLHEDACFNSDWWEDYRQLEKLGCRKNYMDEYKMSKFLKQCMKRMKPAEVSEIQCRNLQYFRYGHDYQQLKSLWPKDQQFPPKRVYMIVRVYNFTQGKNTFNMQIKQKIQQSKRKKAVAVKLLNEGKIQKALKKFQNIVAFYNSGDNIQEGYDQKISALMNSILCLMKLNRYSLMIPLCNIVLEKPKHGFNPDKMSIKAQGIKVQGKVQNSGQDQMGRRQAVGLQQNPKIVQKCLYRKAFALLKTGESKQALQSLDKIQNQSDQVKNLRAQAQKHLQNYQQKTKKMFKNMFG